MAYVITQNCVNDASCVAVCPVNCIHPTPDEPDYPTAEMLYIDPEACINCGACVLACPVGAIDPDYDLPQEFIPFQDLNAQYFKDPAHQDYPSAGAAAPKRLWEGAPEGPLKVAVVGSGPAASYAAEDLLGKRGISVQVDMFERLATPWGLVRHGVAPDHQSTKQVTDGFMRVARRPGFRLFLGVEVGETITHDDLVARYHAVIYAVGASGDRRLDVPGENLPGSHSASEFVAWYNGHPEYADRTFDLSSERAVIFGNGNVALDVARILLQDVDALRQTDIADHALEQLAASRIREVLVVGRRGPAQAAFTSPELLGLANVPGVDLVVWPNGIPSGSDERAGGGDQSLDRYKASLIADLGSRSLTSDRRVILRFLASPLEIVGEGRVESVRLTRNVLVAERGAIRAVPNGEVEDVDCGLVLRAVGYHGHPVPGLPFDEERGVLPNVLGRVVDPSTRATVPGAYATGWIKRGPSGVIGTNKHCARETVRALLDDWTAGLLAPPVDDSDVAGVLPTQMGIEAWKAIDDFERAAGRAASRPRVKLVNYSAQLDVIAASA